MEFWFLARWGSRVIDATSQLISLLIKYAEPIVIRPVLGESQRMYEIVPFDPVRMRI